MFRSDRKYSGVDHEILAVLHLTLNPIGQPAGSVRDNGTALEDSNSQIPIEFACPGGCAQARRYPADHNQVCTHPRLLNLLLLAEELKDVKLAAFAVGEEAIHCAALVIVDLKNGLQLREQHEFDVPP